MAGDQGEYLAPPRGNSKVRALVDANVLVRHLTSDPPGQAKRATAFLRNSHELILTDLVLAEMVYILESFYEVARTDIARMSRSLLALPSIETGDHELLLRTVEIYEVLRLDFAEAYLSALAEMSDVKRVLPTALAPAGCTSGRVARS